MAKTAKIKKLVAESRSKALPKGLKAAAPIQNEKLRNLLAGEEITGSGGTHTVIDGRPLLGRRMMRH